MDIVHQHTAGEFTLDVEGLTSRIDYTLHGKVMTITHTRVPEALEGRGLASKLTQAAFDHARAQGWKVVPQCSYAASWAKRHPDVEDLLA